MMRLLVCALGVRAFAPSTSNPRPLSARARSVVYSSMGLEWNDNAFWLEACEELGVVSWYDAGLRLTDESAPAAPEAKAAAPVAETPVAEAPAEMTDRIKTLRTAGEVTIAQRAEKLAAYTAAAAKLEAETVAAATERIATLKAEGEAVISKRAQRLSQYEAAAAKQAKAAAAAAAARIATLTAEGKEVISKRATALAQYEAATSKQAEKAAEAAAARINELQAQGEAVIAKRATALAQYEAAIEQQKSASFSTKFAQKLSDVSADELEALWAGGPPPSDAELETCGSLADMLAPLQLREPDDIEKAFELIDADGSGALDADELLEAAKILSVKLSRAEADEMLRAVDADGNGKIDLDEFRAALAARDNASQASAADDGSPDTAVERGVDMSASLESLLGV